METYDTYYILQHVYLKNTTSFKSSSALDKY